MADISVIILTFNEGKHITRCINSLKSFAKEIFIVDSFSTDSTVEMALSEGAKVFQNKYTNQAIQFNWALKTCPISTEWVMRIDADEYILPALSQEISEKLPYIDVSVSGIYIKRRVIFLNKWIKRGGNYPIWFLRIFRTSKGISEERWMDEHIKISDGKTIHFKNDFVDENLNSLTWWINRQNSYATREMIVQIIEYYKLDSNNTIEPKLLGKPDQRKRWFKNIYGKLPLFIRPFILFNYNYIIRGGFRDGYPGLIRHFLLSFWYRFLVDSKLYEIEKKCNNDIILIKQNIYNDHGYKI